MDEEIWELYDHETGHSAYLRRVDPRHYEFTINGYAIASMDLDRKHLKDLWNALGDELGAFDGN